MIQYTVETIMDCIFLSLTLHCEKALPTPRLEEHAPHMIN